MENLEVVETVFVSEYINRFFLVCHSFGIYDRIVSELQGEDRSIRTIE